MLKHITLFLSYILITYTNANATGMLTKGFADIVEPLMPTVVNVYTVQYPKTSAQIPNNPFKGMPDPFFKFFENFDFPTGLDEMYSNPKAMSLGSGVIISAEGYIVTNHHVVANADEVNVKLSDNTELSAKIIGTDERTDIALLKVENKTPLPYVKFGDSSKARVGDWIIAIGNPFGLGGTVTTGIVSSKGRDITTDTAGIVDDFIQTDAAINSGNSGGPMFNMSGEVIGINTAIFSPSGSSIGIGFAIPSSTADKVVEQLKKYGKVSRGFLNIKIQEITPEIADAMNIGEARGALVIEVDKSGTGYKAGLLPGDIIIKVGDVEIKNSRKLQISVAEVPVNTEIKLTVLRDGKKKELSCKITEAARTRNSGKQNNPLQQSFPQDKTFEIHGIVFADMTEDWLNDGEHTSGVVIIQTKQNTTWKGLMRGDLVLSINQQPINSLQELKEAYNSAVQNNKKHVALFVKRNNNNIFLALPL